MTISRNPCTFSCPMMTLFRQLFHSVHLRADDSKCGGVRGKHGVQPLGFLCGITRIVVAHLPLLMPRLCQSTPSPEVTACEMATLLGIVAHEREDVFIEAVSAFGGCIQGEQKTIRLCGKLHPR